MKLKNLSKIVVLDANCGIHDIAKSLLLSADFFPVQLNYRPGKLI